MEESKAKPMGEIHCDVLLENTDDRAVVNRGSGRETDIRHTTGDGMVDTGAVTLVLPQNVVERLGLGQQGTAFVSYADERREERPLAGPVTVRIGNRSMRMDCVVGPPLRRGSDRTRRPRNPRPDRRLHQPDTDAPVPRLPAPEAQGNIRSDEPTRYATVDHRPSHGAGRAGR